MPGAEEPEQDKERSDDGHPNGPPMEDKVFEAMLEDFDQDAWEAVPKEPEPMVEGPAEAPDLVPEEEEEEVEPPAAEGKGRGDKLATSPLSSSKESLLCIVPAGQDEATVLSQRDIQAGPRPLW